MDYCDFNDDFCTDVKRIWLHIAFWTIYVAQDIFLQFSYMQRFIQDIPVGKQLLMATETCLLILPIKMLLTYFAVYYFLNAVLANPKKIFFPLLAMIGMTVLCVILFRVVYFYYINPVVYSGIETHSTLFGILTIWTTFLEIGFVAAIAAVIKFVRLQLKSRETEKNLIKEKLETELKFLRNQTNPHFLFNTLNNIYSLALRKSDETPEIVMKLSKLLNFMIYESRKQTISIGEEVKILDDYIEIERIRYDSRLDISFIREIDNENEQISPLLLLSFIENSFKHGASESRFESFIHIEMEVKKGILNFSVANNKENNHSQHKGGNIGLANTRRQIELMYTEYALNVEEKENRFNVFLMINLNSHAKI